MGIYANQKWRFNMTISSITNTFNEIKIDFEEDLKKENVSSDDEELILEEQSLEKSIYHAVDNRYNLHEIKKMSLDSDLVERINDQARSIACFISTPNLHKDENYVSNQEYVFNNVLTLNERIKEKHGYPLEEKQKFREELAPGLSTGFLVCDRRTVLTAAHSMYEKGTDTLISLDSYRLVFNFQHNKNDVYRFKENSIYKITKLIAHYKHNSEIETETDSEDGDWALLELDREVEDSTPLDIDFSNVQNSDRNFYKEGRSVYMLGHPDGLPLKVAMNAQIIKSNKCMTNLCKSDVHGFTGNSGPPLFDQTTGKVVGLYIRGNKDYEPFMNKQTNQWEVRAYRVYNSIKREGYEICQKINSIFYLPYLKLERSAEGVLSACNNFSKRTIRFYDRVQSLRWGPMIGKDCDSIILELNKYKNKLKCEKAIDIINNLKSENPINKTTSLEFNHNQLSHLVNSDRNGLYQFTNLRSLQVNRLTDECMDMLSQLPNLTSLVIQDCLCDDRKTLEERRERWRWAKEKYSQKGCYFDGFSSSDMAHKGYLSPEAGGWELLTNLENLEIDNGMSPLGVKKLTKLTKLKTLKINSQSEEVKEAVKNLKNKLGIE
jgi:V8-like Glu-specific endopeptidase